MYRNDVRYKGLRLFPSTTAMRELMQEGKDLYFVLKILEQGYNPGTKRSKGIIEKCWDRGSKTYKVVVVKDYHNVNKEWVYVIIHFGKFGRKK